MAKSPNGLSVRNWLAFALGVALIFGTICVAWGGQRSAVAANTERIEKVETALESIADLKVEVVRIRTILEEQAKRKENP